MGYEFKLKIDGDQVDELVVASLKDAYEDCVFTLFDPAKQKFDPVEDVVRRQEGLATVLNYFMIPQEYQGYMEFWNNYTQKDYDESQITGSNI